MHKYLTVICIIGLAACPSAHAAETIYVGGSGGSTEQLFKEKIIPAFEAKTAAKVVYVPGNSTDILAKLLAQKGKQEISVALIDDGPMYQAIGQGLCAKVDDIGSMKELNPNARMIGDKWGGIGFI